MTDTDLDAAGRAASTAAPPTPSAPLLHVEELGVSFARPGGGRRIRVLDDVELTVRPGEIVGVVGETGSGKTTLARAIAGLTTPDGGRVLLDDRDIARLRGRARRRFRRGGAIQFVFQDPLRSLDPELTVGTSVGEGLAIAGVGSRAQRAERVADALRQVGLDPAVADQLPAQLSGGQRQRASIARAVVADPRLLLCDEPVSALDASNRNHILLLLDELRRRLAVGIVVISHDLSSLAGIADRVVVLYRGRVVETGPIADVFTRPRHPYTALLIASAPDIHGRDRLAAAQLRSQRPDDDATARQADGCVFAHRCRFATDVCARTPPSQDAAGRPAGDWTVACHHTDTWRNQTTATAT
ncbi:ABC transporter ATP-binding protein, partial [Frankia tisae]|uniref:ABC transporter ATP-binding protein n=1 Tax=Frankia tisae TaxID=2950104 RepID=UPI0021BF6795